MDVEMDTSFSDGNGDAMDLGGGSETSRTGRRMAGLRSFRIPLFQPSTVQRTRKTHEDVPFTTMAEPGTCDAPGHVLPGDVEPTMVSISNHFLELAKDKLSVRYIGKVGHLFD